MIERAKYMVLIIKYEQESEEIIENLVKSITDPINTKYGEIQRVYQGSEARIISALKKIMSLTE